jgi:hypothetical protein
MTTRPSNGSRRRLERLMAARASTRAKTAAVLSRPLSELSDHAVLRRQRTARKAIAEALRESHGATGARAIAFHLSEWFEEAAFIVALQLDPKRFSNAEIDAGVSGVLAHVLDHVWEAVRAAGGPLPYLPDETPARGDDEEDS